MAEKSNHKIMEYPEREGIHQDHRVQLLPCTEYPKNSTCRNRACRSCEGSLPGNVLLLWDVGFVHPGMNFPLESHLIPGMNPAWLGGISPAGTGVAIPCQNSQCFEGKGIKRAPQGPPCPTPQGFNALFFSTVTQSSTCGSAEPSFALLSPLGRSDLGEAAELWWLQEPEFWKCEAVKKGYAWGNSGDLRVE